MTKKVVDKKLPSNLLAGKTAVVTGGSRGIGRATALRLAEAGANVVVNYYQHKDDAESVVNECKQLGVEALAVKADVANLDEVNHLIGQALEKFGTLDLVVANAGIWEGAPVE